MRRTSKTDSRRNHLPRLVSYRPLVELLEDRLHPGDILLGQGLVGSLIGQNISILGADSVSALNRQTQTRFDHDSPQFSTFVRPEANGSASTVLFAASRVPSQQERIYGPAD